MFQGITPFFQNREKNLCLAIFGGYLEFLRKMPETHLSGDAFRKQFFSIGPTFPLDASGHSISLHLSLVIFYRRECSSNIL